jgi:hypothetical protein
MTIRGEIDYATMAAIVGTVCKESKIARAIEAVFWFSASRAGEVPADVEVF